MSQYVPALSILIAFMVIALVILTKLKSEQLPTLLDSKNGLLLYAAALFCVLLVVHLFKEQTWTADLLAGRGRVNTVLTLVTRGTDSPT